MACAASGKAGGFLASDWCSHSPLLDKLTRNSFRLHTELAEALDGAENYEYRTLDTFAVSTDLSYNPVTKSDPKMMPDDSAVRILHRISLREAKSKKICY